MKQVYIRLCALVLGAFAFPYILFTSFSPAVVQEEPQSTYQFYLRDYDGMLALFAQDGTTPIEVFDVFTDSLPPEDRKRVQSGIAIVDEVQLQRMIEDYTS